MGDLKLFKLDEKKVVEIDGSSVTLEKSLQNLIEKNLESFLGVRFLASEHPTGKKHAGRIDTLGIDENGCPVIIEYKRAVNENIINQGLFYLDWLMDHKAEFKLLVMEKYGKDVSESIEWTIPRLLCIAGDFTKYDTYAVDQINRNIELIRYRKFGNNLLMFELVNVTSGQEIESEDKTKKHIYKTIGKTISELEGELSDRYESLKSFLIALGDDVQMKILKYYIVFRRIKNFACVEFRTQSKSILIYTKIDPKSINLEEGFTRDVTKIGHYGTGDLEITISSDQDLEKAKNLIIKSYEYN